MIRRASSHYFCQDSNSFTTPTVLVGSAYPSRYCLMRGDSPGPKLLRLDRLLTVGYLLLP